MTPLPLVLAVLSAIAAPPAFKRNYFFPQDPAPVYVVEENNHNFAHTFAAGLSFFPSDPFYLGGAVNGSYSYHFNEKWAWAVVDGFYARSFELGFYRDVFNYGAQPAPDPLRRIEYGIASLAVLKPTYGKAALFNRYRSYFDTVVLFGPGMLGGIDGLARSVVFAPVLGVQFQLWLNNRFSLKLDVRDYLAFVELAPRNVFSLSLMAVVNVSPKRN